MKAYVIRWSCIYRHCCILSAMAEFNSKIKKDFTLNILSKKDKDYPPTLPLTRKCSEETGAIKGAIKFIK